MPSNKIDHDRRRLRASGIALTAVMAELPQIASCGTLHQMNEQTPRGGIRRRRAGKQGELVAQQHLDLVDTTRHEKA